MRPPVPVDRAHNDRAYNDRAYNDRAYNDRAWRLTTRCHDCGDGQGDSLQRVRGILTGILVGIPLAIFVIVWLHGVVEVAALIGGGVALAIALVVGTRSDAHDDAADRAWREAARDLPPVSDRTTLERSQVKMPGPAKRRSGAAPGVPDGLAPGSSAIGDAEPR